MIELVATEAGCIEECETISCGASNAKGTDAYHYINFQRASEYGGTDDNGVYFEIDDQINGGYNIVDLCELREDKLIITLSNCFDRMPNEIVEVSISSLGKEDITLFKTGLEKIFFGYEKQFNKSA